jgi:LmbE family N-acetylglucosaminyl deacetylase
MDLIRDLLDSQLIDREKTKMGRVDGIVLSFADDGRPHIDHLEVGFVVMARRIHPRIESCVQSLRRWSVRRSARYMIPWSKVIDVSTQTVQIDVKAEETPQVEWERWFGKHVIDRIPGGGGK